jgi:hypothetical protein
MTPLPGEGRVSQTIANYKAIEALQADLYVAGHGDPGTLSDARAQRVQLERLLLHARNYFERMLLLCSYWEFAGKRPGSTDPAAQDHMAMLQGVAAEAKLMLARRGAN